MNYEAVEKVKMLLVKINIPSSWATATEKDIKYKEPEFIKIY